MSRDSVAWVTSMPTARSRSRSCSWLVIASLSMSSSTWACRNDFISIQRTRNYTFHTFRSQPNKVIALRNRYAVYIYIGMNSYAEPVRVGIAGATGYTGVELLRLLARHPAAVLAAAMGSPGAAPRIVPALKRVWDAPVDALDVDALADKSDAVFLALPEHAAADIAPPLLARGKRVFDLSGAFRLRDASLRRRWYPQTPEPSQPVVYGLTERNRERLRDSTFVACAGCYPTAAILALQ